MNKIAWVLISVLWLFCGFFVFVGVMYSWDQETKSPEPTFSTTCVPGAVIQPDGTCIMGD